MEYQPCTQEQWSTAARIRKEHNVVRQHYSGWSEPRRLFLYVDDDHTGAEFGLTEVSIHPDGRDLWSD